MYTFGLLEWAPKPCLDRAHSLLRTEPTFSSVQSRLHPSHRADFTLRTEPTFSSTQSSLIPQAKPPKTYALTPSDCTHSLHVCNNLYLCPANLGATYASEVFTKQRN